METKEFVLSLLKHICSWPIIGFIMFLIVYASFDLKDLSGILRALQANGISEISVGDSSITFDIPDEEVTEIEEEAKETAFKEYEGSTIKTPEMLNAIDQKVKAISLAKTFDYWMQQNKTKNISPTEALNTILLSDPRSFSLIYRDYVVGVDEIKKLGYKINKILSADEFKMVKNEMKEKL